MSMRRLADFSPGRTILTSLLITIGLGTVLLALPGATTVPMRYLDLFFTATSATCVCGLFTMPLEHFTFFGHAVILGLIQIGGLGLITMTLFVMSLFINLGMATSFMAGQLLELESWVKIKQLLIFIICMTICFELIGTILIFLTIKDHFPIGQAFFLASFQSISSFCNAGISLFPIYRYHYEYHPPILIISALLMFCGGLGFITWRELLQYGYAWRQKRRYTLSLYSKIVLSWSCSVMTVVGILFWILERDNILKEFTTWQSVAHTILHAVSFKSAGLITFVPAELQLATLIVIMLSALIGSAPGSTGSGIKITTLAVFISTIKSAIAGKASTDIRGRHIPIDQVYKTIAIVSCSVGWVVLMTFCLLITECNLSFLSILFEAHSAFTTLGISLGITPLLSGIGKLFIILSMIIGRIGSLTLLLALRKRRLESTGIKYPEERIMLG